MDIIIDQLLPMLVFAFITITLTERHLIDALLAPGGGTQVSGDSGTGKSVFLLWCVLAIARSTRYPLLLIDPKGDLAKKAHVTLLSMGESFGRRIQYVAPGNTKVPILPMNPLAIDHDDEDDEYTRQAKLSCKVRHTAHTVLAFSGEEDFDMKPLLFKWTVRLLRTVAELGMSMADVLHFLNPHSEAFGALTPLVRDELSRRELEELAGVPAHQRELLIASTKNRFVNLFENPIMRAHLGTIETPRFRDFYERGDIVLVDLEPRGCMSEEDVSFFSNLWLQEALHCVFNVPAEQRIPFFICCDETPRLEPSFPLIAGALRIIRGLQCRLLLAHQGIFCFREQK